MVETMYNESAKHRVAPEKSDPYRPGFALYIVKGNAEGVVMTDIIKVCKIHGDLNLDQVTKFKNEKYYRCNECIKIKNNRAYRNNIDKRLSEAANYRKQNQERIMLWARQDRALNPEKYKLQHSEGYKGRKYRRKFKSHIAQFGLTIESYELMVESQKNLCAICLQPETRKDPKNDRICRLCIDHCHKTDKVRELLCHGCNTGIGKFKDDIELLNRAIAYLEKHQ